MQWNLIKLRKEHKLNQYDVAEMLGINISTYQNKEWGKSSFKDYEMFILSRHFNESIEDIFLPTNCIDNAN